MILRYSSKHVDFKLGCRTPLISGALSNALSYLYLYFKSYLWNIVSLATGVPTSAGDKI